MNFTRPSTRLFAVLCTTVALMAASSAQANSRFHVENFADKTIKVDIYNGEDIVCGSAAKSKRIAPGERASFGCAGQGSNRCKVTPYFPDASGSVCNEPSRYDTCDRLAIVVAHGRTLMVSNEPQYCEIRD